MTTQKWPNYLYCILSATVNIWLFPLLMGSDLAKKAFNSTVIIEISCKYKRSFLMSHGDSVSLHCIILFP